MENKLLATGAAASEFQKANIAALVAQTEKPQHYAYLKEFRVEQCQLFKEHKCTQHRPYTCFNWHFPNQRRRRPVRRKDGTFNYSPDIYCTKYDENSGVCPDGEECPFLHRVAGDVERKYHLRYYKTCLCVHPTDSKGNCSKNGPHCAFAHGPDDLRPPVFDIRDLQAQHDLGSGGDPLQDSARTNYVVEDPVWEDQNYVLANYKTEQCRKPPRLCRQGYACPYFHNPKDKRRTPKTYKYRSTPCPSVKHAEEWGDPETCDLGDQCTYCHTRTEQQFHPEIYKSTKCNDMVQHGYCPRGPFCAFAHTENEMKQDREGAMKSSLLTAGESGGRPRRSSESVLCGGGGGAGASGVGQFGAIGEADNGGLQHSAGISIRGGPSDFGGFAASPPTSYLSSSAPGMPIFGAGRSRKFPSNLANGGASPILIARNGGGAEAGGTFGSPSYSAILKQRQQSGNTKNAWGGSGGVIPENSVPVDIIVPGSTKPLEGSTGSYPKAIGFEREVAHRQTSVETSSPAHSEAARIKAALYLQHEIGCTVSNTGTGSLGTPSTPGSTSTRSHSFSFSQSYFTPKDAMENVIENVAGEGEDSAFTFGAGRDDGDRSRSGSIHNTAYSHIHSSPALYSSSAPVTIPQQSGSSFGQSSLQYISSPSAEDHGQGSMFRMSGSFNQSLFDFMPIASAQLSQPQQQQQPPVPLSSANSKEGTMSTEGVEQLQRTNMQLKQFYEMSKQETEEWKAKCLQLEHERVLAMQQRDEAIQQANNMATEMRCFQQSLAAAAFLHQLNANNNNNNNVNPNLVGDVQPPQPRQQPLPEQLVSQLKLVVERYNDSM